MPLFDRITDMLLGAGTEGGSGLTELLTRTLAAEKHAERVLAYDFMAALAADADLLRNAVKLVSDTETGRRAKTLLDRVRQ